MLLCVCYLTGAVAGLADQPLQGLWSDDASVTDRATGVVTGVGKGLIGVVTKPISGTAEFISQTGHGEAQGIRLIKMKTSVAP